MKRCTKMLGLMLALVLGVTAVAAAADDYKKFGVRMRGIYVKPNESVDARVNGITQAVYKGDLHVSDDIIPELDLEYFFHKNFSVEAIAGVTRHDLMANGQYIGSTWLLPPTVTLKYHPLAGNTVSPYVGIGANIIFPFSSKLEADKYFTIDNSFGYAVQFGTDIKLKDDLYFNIDYKYLNADTKANIGHVGYKLDLNPNLFGIGLGYRF